MSDLPHLSVCICTCGRPLLLERLLREIATQQTENAFTFSVVVADNDAAQSGRAVVEHCGKSFAFQVQYVVEPEKNIALARNAALSEARGEYIVFIDDDEFPAPFWLLNLFRTCQTHKAAGVLGPVKPHFEQTPPSWLIKGRFYERPTHATGFVMGWQECRTGNVLFRRSILEAGQAAFRREFGTGGEDQDFFRRMTQKGHQFIWCDEAVAFEEVPPSRWSRRFLLSRALLRGRNSFRHPRGRLRNLCKSAVAVPVYLLALPVLLLVGHHYFMRYLVKSADHLGRLLAPLGLNPVRERQM